jgi:uncharacterized membrane protein (UPF0127 family)
MMSPRTDRFAFSLVLLLTLLACKGDGQQDISPQMDQVSQDQSAAQGVVIKVAGNPVRVQVSETLGERQRGLMFTESLPADQGMLFVFEREQILSFWMKNTPLPLSVAFIDRKGRIVEIRRMEPLDEDTLHTSRRPAMYALEMNAGWFQEHQVKVGDSVEF